MRLIARRLFSVLALALLCGGRPLPATQLDIAGPPGSVAFGTQVKVLPNGNIAITDPTGVVAGAGGAYLYRRDGTQISALTGGAAGDNVGSGGIIVLPSGNFLVLSPHWHNGANADAGAVTFVNGTTGRSGVVSAANSLVGSSAGDSLNAAIVVLANGNYVVCTPEWSNAGAASAGAVTLGSANAGVAGFISPANSLVGASADDRVGANVTKVGSGNFVVAVPEWDRGGLADAGAATWVSGTLGRVGAITPGNSLVGASAGDRVGSNVVALSSGNYVVQSPIWTNGATAGVGAVTWGSGATGIAGEISATNSLIGTTANDSVGFSVAALTNGHYVVGSQQWDDAPTASDVGAATWGDGFTGTSGLVSKANSIVGTRSNDSVGSGSVTPLSNGNYVVSTFGWNNGSALVGAVTWADGTQPTSAVVGPSNSLVGATAGDSVSLVTALTNGNYVVRAPQWDNGATPNAGAATLCSGLGPTAAVVSAANSLVGTSEDDEVGLDVTALANGNYLVRSRFWDGTGINAGAVTWGSGTAGVSGLVSAANSLVGVNNQQQVGYFAVALTNGNAVVLSGSFGGATFINGATGLIGSVSAANSLTGSIPTDSGVIALQALANGNYVVRWPTWGNYVGAISWGNGTTGTSGPVSASNSLVGSTAFDVIGNGSFTAYPDGNYVVTSPGWQSGGFVVGAATLGGGAGGQVGPLDARNSVLGTASPGQMSYDYDLARHTLVLGRPASSLVSLFDDRVFADGFE